MDKITSFTINHLKLLPGIYVSRKDTVGGHTVTTFDLRMTRPNYEPVINTAEIRVRVGFGQRIAPRVINRVRDYFAVFVYGKQRTAKVAGAIPHLEHIVCSKVTLQVFTAFTALCTGCITILCGDSGAVLVVHITLGEAAVLCYQYITVGRRKIVHNIVL